MNKPLYEVYDMFSKEVIMKETSTEISLRLRVSKRAIQHAQQCDRRVQGRYKIRATGESVELHPRYEIENFDDKTQLLFLENKSKAKRQKKVVTATVLPKRRNSQSTERKERIEETAGLRDATFKETIVNAQNYVVTNTYFNKGNEVYLLKTFAHGHKDKFSHLLNQ